MIGIALEEKWCLSKYLRASAIDSTLYEEGRGLTIVISVAKIGRGGKFLTLYGCSKDFWQTLQFCLVVYSLQLSVVALSCVELCVILYSSVQLLIVVGSCI